MKKTISILLSLLLLAMTFPAAAMSPSEVVYGSCGDGLTWILNSATGYLRITGEGAMYDYSSGTSPFHPYRSFIREVDIRDGVTTVGDMAFDSCYLMESVILPETLVSIWSGAFYGCSSLESVTIPPSVQTVGDQAFMGCSSLEYAFFLGMPPASAGADIFLNCAADFCIFYNEEYAPYWAPNGETEWQGNPILQFQIPTGTGDIDGDGEVTSSDALVALRVSLGILFVTPEMITAGDMDGDGELTTADALMILRLALGA